MDAASGNMNDDVISTVMFCCVAVVYILYK